MNLKSRQTLTGSIGPDLRLRMKMTAMSKRTRRLDVMLSDEENKLLSKRLTENGISNKSAYVRKMILDGAVVKVNIPEISRLISQLKYIGNNVNQLAAAANSGAPVSETAVNSVKAELEKIWNVVNGILSKLTEALREM
jgi:hypothetical protein